MTALRSKKALLLLWFLLINYAFIGWAASCGGRPFLQSLTDTQTEVVLLGSVPAAALVLFFIKPFKTCEEKRSFLCFAAILIFIINAFWLTIIHDVFA